MEIKNDWAYYFCKVEDTSASIRLNLALAQIAPIKEYGFRIWFSVKLLNPNDNGLTTNEEFPKISAIEDDISEVLEDNGAIMVGTVKNNGTADLYLYSKQADNYEALIQSVMVKHKDYLYAIDIEEDKEWTDYFDFLYPAEYEMQTIQNRKVLMQLDQLEDNSEKERKVDHWIYFKKENDRENFTEAVVNLGYTILSKEKVEGDNSFQLNIDRIDNTIWDNVDNYVWELVTLAKENNGVYDGWGCPIEK